MKKWLSFALLVGVLTGFVISGTSANALAEWSFPEPSGIASFDQ